MAVLKLKINSSRDAASLNKEFQTPGGKQAIAQRVVNFINQVYTGSAGASSGAPSIAIEVQNNEVRATGTITLSGAGAANDTILINGVTFTAKASGAVGDQWNVGATATLSAAAMAAAINASATALVSGYVTASSLAGVVTIQSVFYGLSGNAITIAKGVDAGSVMTVSGARLTGGAVDANALTLSF